MEPGRDDFHGARGLLWHHAPALGVFHGHDDGYHDGEAMAVLGPWALGSVAKV